MAGPNAALWWLLNLAAEIKNYTFSNSHTLLLCFSAIFVKIKICVFVDILRFFYFENRVRVGRLKH